jgi:hypothetical protein
VLFWPVTFVVTCGAETVSNRFGFTGPEIFPIDNQISQLHWADLDGDGLNDLIVVNNARSKINLLYNQTGKTNPADARWYARVVSEGPVRPGDAVRHEGISACRQRGGLLRLAPTSARGFCPSA